jgi:Lar family restriction alleviation protein
MRGGGFGVGIREVPELKPCPFCGGAKVKVGHVRDGRAVFCDDCGAKGPSEYHGRAGDEPAEHRAADSWNERLASSGPNLADATPNEPTPVADAEVEALRDGPPGGLCYVRHDRAWFTTAPLIGPARQWGDDWNDAPYEHNAGSPYSEKGETLTAVPFYAGDLVTPDDMVANSRWSVEDINAGRTPWLKSSSYAGGSIRIMSGASFNEFREKVRAAGGEVYAPWPDALLARLTAAEQENAKLTRQIRALAVALHTKHFASEAPGWQPLEDAEGILWQIDNMTTALRALPGANPAAQGAVAWQWCVYENGEQRTAWEFEGHGDRTSWSTLAKREPETVQVVTRALYASPPEALPASGGVEAPWPKGKGGGWTIDTEFLEQVSKEMGVWRNGTCLETVEAVLRAPSVIAALSTSAAAGEDRADG